MTDAAVRVAAVRVAAVRVAATPLSEVCLDLAARVRLETGNVGAAGLLEQAAALLMATEKSPLEGIPQ